MTNMLVIDTLEFHWNDLMPFSQGFMKFSLLCFAFIGAILCVCCFIGYCENRRYSMIELLIFWISLCVYVSLPCIPYFQSGCAHTYAPVYASQRYQFQPDCLSMTRDSNRKPSYYTLLLLLSLVVHNEQPHLNSCMKAKFVIQTKEAFDIYSYSEFLLLLLLLSKL